MPSNILTYTGRSFDPLNPDPEQIDIRDIAQATSNICRFTGHVSRFYSVAEHSCRVSDMVPSRYALWGLLHDASEAYLGDVARPVKQMTDFYQVAEANLMYAILTKYDLPVNMPQCVHQADNDMLLAERDELLPTNDAAELVWPSGNGSLVVDDLGWTPRVAYDEFLSRFASLVPGVPLPV